MAKYEAAGKIIRAIRERNGLTQEGLAPMLDYAEDTMRRIDEGKRRISRRKAMILRNKFHISDDELNELLVCSGYHPEPKYINGIKKTLSDIREIARKDLKQDHQILHDVAKLTDRISTQQQTTETYLTKEQQKQLIYAILARLQRKNMQWFGAESNIERVPPLPIRHIGPYSIIDPHIRKYSIKRQRRSLVWALRRFKRIALVGEMGSGKTTLMKYIAYRFALDYLAHGDSKPIPLLLEMRWSSGNLAADIVNQFRAAGVDIEVQDCFKVLANGGFLILLDGIDEVTSVDFTGIGLRNIIDASADNYIVLSARGIDHVRGMTLSIFKMAPLILEADRPLILRILRCHIDGIQAQQLLDKIWYELDYGFILTPLYLSILAVQFNKNPNSVVDSRLGNILDNMVDQIMFEWESKHLTRFASQDLPSTSVIGACLVRLAEEMTNRSQTYTPAGDYSISQKECLKCFRDILRELEYTSIGGLADKILKYLVETHFLSVGTSLVAFQQAGLRELFAARALRESWNRGEDVSDRIQTFGMTIGKHPWGVPTLLFCHMVGYSDRLYSIIREKCGLFEPLLAFREKLRLDVGLRKTFFEECGESFYELGMYVLKNDIVAALGALGTEDCIPYLNRCVSEGSGVAASVAIAMGRIGSTQCLPKLHLLLTDYEGSSSTRLYALDAVRRIANATSIPHLLDALVLINDRSWTYDGDQYFDQNKYTYKRPTAIQIQRRKQCETKQIITTLLEIYKRNPEESRSNLKAWVDDFQNLDKPHAEVIINMLKQKRLISMPK